jgi:hypothetical protein
LGRKPSLSERDRDHRLERETERSQGAKISDDVIEAEALTFSHAQWQLLGHFIPANRCVRHLGNHFVISFCIPGVFGPLT